MNEELPSKIETRFKRRNTSKERSTQGDKNADITRTRERNRVRKERKETFYIKPIIEKDWRILVPR